MSCRAVAWFHGLRLQLAPILPLAALAGTAQAAHERADFNGDGFDDLIVAVQNENPGGHTGAGAVHVIYGSISGLSAANDQIWHQGKPFIKDDPEDGDGFGRTVCVGDFNGDGFDDAAIGVPGERIAMQSHAGAVNVLYGSANGLQAPGDQFWNQKHIGVPGDPQVFDLFGDTLAAGDFDNDGFDDLAVGVPGDQTGGLAGAGAVHIFKGSAAGLTTTATQYWSQNSTDIADACEVNDQFGEALIAGNFNGDDFDDLAIGVPGETDSTGLVHVLFGSADGLSAGGSQVWDLDAPDVLGQAGTGDAFGQALGAGDFNNDSFDDLAIGVPGDDHGSIPDVIENAGAVQILYGSAVGLTAFNNQRWRQGADGILGAARANDSFGRCITVGDFDGDGRADLAVSATRDRIAGLDEAGSVNILYSSDAGLTAEANQLWMQDSEGIADEVNANEHFGSALASGDFNDDGMLDLAIGVQERINSQAKAGAVHVLYGAASPVRLSADGAQFWHQNVTGMLDTAEPGDHFGGALGSR